MSKKLTEEKIDKMIKELLQEKSSDPLDREYDDNKLRYYKGNKDFHTFDQTNLRGEMRESNVNAGTFIQIN